MLKKKVLTGDNRSRFDQFSPAIISLENKLRESKMDDSMDAEEDSTNQFKIEGEEQEIDITLSQEFNFGKDVKLSEHFLKETPKKASKNQGATSLDTKKKGETSTEKE